MKAKLLTALLAMVVSTSVFAVQKTTVGAVDCGEWIARKGDSNGSNIPNHFSETRANAWLVGFMTGLNFSEREGDPLKKASAAQIFLWMDNFCKANPLKTVVDGGQILMMELEKK